MSYESFKKLNCKLAVFEAQLKTFAAEAQIRKALEFTCVVCLSRWTFMFARHVSIQYAKVVFAVIEFSKW